MYESVPTRPWEAGSTDLFTWNGKDYLLIVDSYSHYIEIGLSNTSSKIVVMHTKSIFVRHGIPKKSKVTMDRSTQHKSTKDLVMNGDLSTATSPYHPQANGLAEKSVTLWSSC